MNAHAYKLTTFFVTTDLQFGVYCRFHLCLNIAWATAHVLYVLQFYTVVMRVKGHTQNSMFERKCRLQLRSNFRQKRMVCAGHTNLGLSTLLFMARTNHMLHTECSNGAAIDCTVNCNSVEKFRQA